MRRTASFLVVLFFGSCARQEAAIHPLEEQAIAQATLMCQNSGNLEWLREIIALAEYDFHYKGSIYAIPYSKGTAFLHQPWISSCFACKLYTCDGDVLSPSEGERNEIIAGAIEKNVIYTSSN